MATSAYEAAVEGTGRSGPLAGVRVVETGSLLAGPLCARLLADYGADVVKIEDPARGDIGRHWGRNKLDGESLWWPLMARNKRCVTINLRDPEGQDLARRLCDSADILVENFRPGTLERWNLGPERLHATNPGLVVVRVSGFGQSGPYRDKAGFGVVGEAIGGLRYTTGTEGEAPPRVGVSIGDQLASVFGVVGALLGLHARRTTGRGQVADVAIYEAVFAMMESIVTEYARLGVLPERTGSRLAGVAPSNIYPTSDGEWIIIGGNAENVFRRLMDAIGDAELAEDPRFSTHTARGVNFEALDAIISAWTRQRSADDVVDALDVAGVPASRIYSPADIVADPHFAARDMLLRIADDKLGELLMPGIVPKMSDTPGSMAWLGPEHGEHTDQVFGKELGISTDELSGLRERGII
ncbi:MAG: CaiB/BaiF CoA transferase family protein [Dehalococcoidia bacterium]